MRFRDGWIKCGMKTDTNSGRTCIINSGASDIGVWNVMNATLRSCFFVYNCYFCWRPRAFFDFSLYSVCVTWGYFRDVPCIYFDSPFLHVSGWLCSMFQLFQFIFLRQCLCLLILYVFLALCPCRICQAGFAWSFVYWFSFFSCVQDNSWFLNSAALSLKVHWLHTIVTSHFPCLQRA